jgi:N-acetylglucosaminyl-diphospho-decaprenol L-rhamnosyltransferase
VSEQLRDLLAEQGIRVVVVTYSPGPSLDVFLSSLAKATLAPYEVVLADNGSTDGVPERAAEAPEVTLVHTGANIGYGRAVNVGARGATAPWLLIVNPDVRWCEPAALDDLIAAASRWPQAGAFGPAIVTPDGQLYPSARALPSLGRGIGHALAGWWWPSNPWTAAYRKENGTPSEGPVGWLSGSALLVRRSAFEAVGGFDPRYFMYFEDVDLCDRLGRAGWASIYVPTAVVEHSGGHATKRSPAAMQRAHHASAYQYLADRYHGPLWAPVRAVLRVGLLGRYLLSRMSRRTAEGAAPTRSAELLDSVSG